mgnify:CR=1 FL=1
MIRTPYLTLLSFCLFLASCAYFDSSQAPPDSDAPVERVDLMSGESSSETPWARAPEDLSGIVSRASGGSVIVYSLDDAPAAESPDSSDDAPAQAGDDRTVEVFPLDDDMQGLIGPDHQPMSDE